MASTQEIQQCINDCTQIANRLRTTTNSINNAAAREMSTIGASHVGTYVSSTRYPTVYTGMPANCR